MNQVALYGRMARDPEIRYTQGPEPIAIAHFTVAVDRPVGAGKERVADFISCQAFRKSAELLEKYFKKGDRIALTGSIRTGSYDNKDGVKVYTTDVVVDRITFVETAKEKGISTGSTGGGFMNIPDGVEDEGLPFN